MACALASRGNATRTAGLSMSGPEVKAISATTKGTRRRGGWRCFLFFFFNKVASRANAKKTAPV